MKDGDKDRYVPTHERQKQKNLEGGWSKDMLYHILNKVEGYDYILKKVKEDVSTLSHAVTFHSVSIEQLKTKMGEISSHLNRDIKMVCLAILWITKE